MTATVLVVDDEKNIRRTLRMVLEGEGCDVRDADSAEQALRILHDDVIDLVICDMRLPGLSGTELLERIRKQHDYRATPVLMISGHASASEAVSALKLGATDFFEKPLDRDRVLVTVRNALRTAALSREVERLRAAVGAGEELLGEGAAMKRLFEEVDKVAPTKARVLITGESGTGKELIARAIHRLSPRHDGPFVRVNCAAIPHELVESELFGHAKGVLAGAPAKKRGHFESAHGGTLLLDEVADMPLAVQAKLLHALQSGEITPVGSDRVIQVDVRVIASSNRDLEREVADGRLREDLYFRLNVVPIHAPALREHPEDIPLLALAFARQFCRENGAKPRSFDSEVLDELQRRYFPGNVRELKNLVERLVILGSERVTLDDLPDEPGLSHTLRERHDQADTSGAIAAVRLVEPSRASDDDADDEPAAKDSAALDADGTETSADSNARPSLRERREAFEREHILDTLREVSGNISRAASLLGLERTNLHKKMRALNIRRDDGGGPARGPAGSS